MDLANRWVVEYVWEMWITESGPTLEGHSADGYDRVRAEQEMRAALEATVSAHTLPDDRPLMSVDFTAAIEGALSSLRRISGMPHDVPTLRYWTRTRLPRYGHLRVATNKRRVVVSH